MSASNTVGKPPWPLYTPPTVVNIRGQEAGYRRAGAGAPVVYIHGLGLTGKWLPFHAALGGRVDLIAPELPGFGGSPLPAWLHSIDDVVTHLDDLLQTLDIGTFHLAGHGLGGWVAARFAVVYPRRLRSLTLISPFGMRVPDDPALDLFRMTPEEADEVLLNGGSDRYADELDLGDPVEATVRSYREITAAARLAWNPRYDIRFERLLDRVSIPSQVIAAQEDHVVPRSHCLRFAELLPHGQLTVVEGGETPTAHLSQLQQPDRLAELIATHVAGVDRTDA